MTTILSTRQSKQNSVLDQLNPASGVPTHEIFNLINKELTPPLRLDCSGANRTISLGGIIIQTASNSFGTERNKTIQPFEKVIPEFTSGQVTFPITSGSITVSGGGSASGNLIIGASQFVKCLITLDKEGEIRVMVGEAAASESAAVLPTAKFGTFSIGYVVLESDGFSEVKNIQREDIFQFMGGGGSSALIVGEQDPTQVAVEADAGLLFADVSVSADARLYQKIDDGLSTNWKVLDWANISPENYSGFPDASGVTIELIDDETFQISGTRTYFVRGAKFKKTAPETKVLGGATGLKFIYYNVDGDLIADDTPFNFATCAPVAIVYWNSNLQLAYALTYELHDLQNADDHYWKHTTVGTRYVNGLQITTATQPDNDVNPADGNSQRITITGGRLLDEDIKIDIENMTGTWSQVLGVGLSNIEALIAPIYYRDSSNVFLRVDPMSDRTAFYHAGANTMPHWNDEGVLTEAEDDDYIVYWVFGSSLMNGDSVFLRPHVYKYASLVDANAASEGELSWAGFPANEVKVLYRLVFRCDSTNFTNSEHRAKLVGVSDFRRTTTGPASASNASQHSALSGRGDANQHPATAINTGTGNFSGTILTSSEGSVQAALDKIDDIVMKKSDSTGNNNYLVKYSSASGQTNVKSSITDDGITVSIAANLVVNGTTITEHAEELNVGDNLIVINSGEQGIGVTAGGGVAGFEVDRGPATDNYVFYFDEADDRFKIGILPNLQAVATREDAPITNGVMWWNNSQNRIDTTNNFTWNGTTFRVPGAVQVDGFLNVGGNNTTSGLVLVPKAIANRPTPQNGILIYNSTNNILEYHNGTTWVGLGAVANIVYTVVTHTVSGTIGIPTTPTINQLDAAITVNISSAVGNLGLSYIFKNVTPGSTQSIEPNGSETIDGVTGTRYLMPGESLTLVSNNSNWVII